MKKTLLLFLISLTLASCDYDSQQHNIDCKYIIREMDDSPVDGYRYYCAFPTNNIYDFVFTSKSNTFKVGDTITINIVKQTAIKTHERDTIH